MVIAMHMLAIDVTYNIICAFQKASGIKHRAVILASKRNLDIEEFEI